MELAACSAKFAIARECAKVPGASCASCMQQRFCSRSGEVEQALARNVAQEARGRRSHDRAEQPRGQPPPKQATSWESASGSKSARQSNLPSNVTMTAT